MQCQDRVCCLTGIMWYLLLRVAQGNVQKAAGFETGTSPSFSISKYSSALKKKVFLSYNLKTMEMFLFSCKHPVMAVADDCSLLCLTVAYLPVSPETNSLSQLIFGPTTK